MQSSVNPQNADALLQPLSSGSIKSSLNPVGATQHNQKFDADKFNSIIGKIPLSINGFNDVNKIDSGTINTQTSNSNSFSDLTTTTENWQNTETNGISKNTSANLSDSESANLSKSQTNSSSQTNTDNSAISTSEQVSNNTGSRINTDVLMNNKARDIALKKFGDPTSALNSLNQSLTARIEFAQDLKDHLPKNSQLTEISQNLSNPRTNSGSRAEPSLGQQFVVDRQAVTGTYDYSANLREQEGQNQLTHTMMPQSTHDREAQYLMGGLTRATSEIYRNEESGLSSVISRSFGFGINYQSGQQILEVLKDKATSDQHLRSALIELGRTGDFKKFTKEIF